MSSSLSSGTENIPLASELKPKSNWLSLVLAAIVVVALLIFLAKGCNGTVTSDSSTVRIDSARLDSAAPQQVSVVRETLLVKLPDGVEMKAYKGGIEDQLVSFLSNAESKVGKHVWFNFDNLNFETGSAVITASSAAQISNINAILKAFPKAKIKIGGYTDKTGDSTANLTLSQARANAVMAALKSAGTANTQLLGAEGYGSEYATVAANGSDAERKTDRRIALGVREK